MNSVLKKDFEAVYFTLGNMLEPLKGKSILITGANGMLASYMAKFFTWLSSAHQFHLSVSGVVREKREEIPGVNYIIEDVCSVILKKKFDFIIHAASLASPIHYNIDPIGVSLPNVVGTINLLKHAENFSPESFLFLSSSEVYGDFGENKDAISENEFGSLSPTDPRSCYAESKRMGENLCISWHKQKGIPVKIVRPFHTYGPGLKRGDGRIYADLIYSIVDRKPIILKSNGEARRAFCYLSDALTGLLLVLLQGKNGEAYNLGNPSQEFSIREAAEMAGSLYPERKVNVSIEDKEAGNYLRSKVLRNAPSIQKLSSLGWSPSIDLEEGMKRTVEYIEGSI